MFGACSDTAYYPLCSEGCGGGGMLGAAGTTDAGEPGGGQGSSTRGGQGGAPASTSTSAGEAGAHGGDAGSDEPAGGGSGAEGTEGGAGGALDRPCDPSLSPVEEPCLVSDAYAVFARSNESSSAGEGSLGNPFGSLESAIRAAEEQQKWLVIACIGTFRKPLEVTRPSGPTLRIFGGFECSSGKASYVGTPTTIETTRGPGLHLSDAHDLELSELEFRARDAKEASESSIAGIVENSTNVTLRRVTLFAGKGMDGAHGGAVLATAAAAPAGIPGTPLGGGSAQPACSCAGTVGGRGGDLNNTATRDGVAGEPALGAGLGGVGGSVCDVGGIGATPPKGESGKGAALLGTLDGTSWVPADGTSGKDGSLAQGGGGGGGGPSGGGGSGGCGGCGGKAGAAGKGGGASIGLLSIDSSLTLVGCAIETSQGGAGGNGQPGQRGQPGGGGGTGAATGCNGGLGGAGSDGGPGGGGAGGISVGVAYWGQAPVIDGEVSDWTIGAPGPGGMGVDETTSGRSGVSEAVLGIGPSSN